VFSAQIAPARRFAKNSATSQRFLTAAETEAIVKRQKHAAVGKRRTGRPQNRFRYATPYGEVEIRLTETGGDLVQRQLQVLAAARRQVTGADELLSAENRPAVIGL
jgi:hypothetical protein